MAPLQCRLERLVLGGGQRRDKKVVKNLRGILPPAIRGIVKNGLLPTVGHGHVGGADLLTKHTIMGGLLLTLPSESL